MLDTGVGLGLWIMPDSREFSLCVAIHGLWLVFADSPKHDQAPSFVCSTLALKAMDRHRYHGQAVLTGRSGPTNRRAALSSRFSRVVDLNDCPDDSGTGHGP